MIGGDLMHQVESCETLLRTPDFGLHEPDEKNKYRYAFEVWGKK